VNNIPLYVKGRTDVPLCIDCLYYRSLQYKDILNEYCCKFRKITNYKSMPVDEARGHGSYCGFSGKCWKPK
jgi:hypothetical protein